MLDLVKSRSICTSNRAGGSRATLVAAHSLGLIPPAQRRVSRSQQKKHVRQKLRYSHRNETGFSLFAKWVPRLKLFLLDRKLIGVCSLLTSMQNLELITCVWSGVSQRARLSIQERSRPQVLSDSSQRRWSGCPRKVLSNRRKKSQEYPRVTFRADELVLENAHKMTHLRMSCATLEPTRVR